MSTSGQGQTSSCSANPSSYGRTVAAGPSTSTYPTAGNASASGSTDTLIFSTIKKKGQAGRYNELTIYPGPPSAPLSGNSLVNLRRYQSGLELAKTIDQAYCQHFAHLIFKPGSLENVKEFVSEYMSRNHPSVRCFHHSAKAQQDHVRRKDEVIRARFENGDWPFPLPDGADLLNDPSAPPTSIDMPDRPSAPDIASTRNLSATSLAQSATRSWSINPSEFRIAVAVEILPDTVNFTGMQPFKTDGTEIPLRANLALSGDMQQHSARVAADMCSELTQLYPSVFGYENAWQDCKDCLERWHENLPDGCLIHGNRPHIRIALATDYCKHRMRSDPNLFTFVRAGPQTVFSYQPRVDPGKVSAGGQPIILPPADWPYPLPLDQGPGSAMGYIASSHARG